MPMNNRIKPALLAVSMLLLISCVKYYKTPAGGIRVYNSKEFKYNKPKFTSRDKTGIDTDAIYLIDSMYTYEQKRRVQSHFIRFFPTGQMLMVSCTGIPTASLVNNRDAGIQGYFIVKGDRIKIDMFQELNGGQTGLFYGKIMDNGDLMFYEQRPEIALFPFNAFAALEKDGQKSFWKKVKVEGIEGYRPEW